MTHEHVCMQVHELVVLTVPDSHRSSNTTGNSFDRALANAAGRHANYSHTIAQNGEGEE